jgi:hypothetical protein
MRKVLIAAAAAAIAFAPISMVLSPVVSADPYCGNGGVEVWTPESHFCTPVPQPPQIAQNGPTFVPPAPYIPPGGLPYIPPGGGLPPGV